MLKLKFARTALAVSLVLGIGLAVPDAFVAPAGSGKAWAQSSQTPPKRKTRRTPAMTARTSQSLEKVQLEIEAKNYAEARKLLSDLLGKKGMNSYEVAMVHNLFAYLYVEQEDYRNAITSYKNVLAQENIPIGVEDGARYALAQLYFVTEDYRTALRLLDEWIKYQESPGYNAYVLKGQAYYALGEFNNAIAPIRTAIKIKNDAQQEVPENWWQILRSIYHEQGNMKEVRTILEHIVVTYPPKATNWVGLAGVYSELGLEERQLAVMEVAYMKGYLDKENYFVNLAQLYMLRQAPIKGSWVMKRGFDEGTIEKNEKNYKLYAQALMMAQEYDDAVAPLRQAARLSKDGELYAQLGYALLALDRSKQAIDAFRQALRKGGLKRADQVMMTIGSAYYNLDEYENAMKAFRQAEKDSRSRLAALNWIKHVRGEIERLQQLRAAMQ